MLAIPLKALEPMDTRTSNLFGKAPYVLLISPDGSAGVLQNQFTSGKELAAELVKRGVKSLIANYLGEKAYGILSSNGVKIFYNNECSSVLLSLDAYKAGALKEFDASLAQEKKHCNGGDCKHEKHGDERCEHEHGHDKERSHGEKCCEKEGGGDKKRKTARDIVKNDN